MKNILPKIYVLLFASLGFLMFGCAELTDCIASARPNLHGKNLSSGHAGTSYSNYIDADVTNDPNDDEYDYFFSVSGNFPPGLTYHEYSQRITFSGTPVQAGTYTFKVRLTIDPKYNYDSRICFGDDTTTKEYTIVIN